MTPNLVQVYDARALRRLARRRADDVLSARHSPWLAGADQRPTPWEQGGTFSPKSIANLVAWWRADLGVTLNGGNVATWTDQSGQGNNLTAAGAAQPAYNSGGGSGGGPWLSFNGANVMAGAPSSPLTDASNWTLFAVQQTTSTTHAGVSLVVGSQKVGNGYALSVDGSATGNREVLQQVVKFCEDGAATTSWEVWVATGGANVALYVNGAAQSLTGAVNQIVAPTAALQLGARDTPDLYWLGGFEEGGIYDRVLTASEVQALTQYLGTRWGIAVS